MHATRSLCMLPYITGLSLSPACLYVLRGMAVTACSLMLMHAPCMSQGDRGPQGLRGGLGDEWIAKVELVKVGG